MDRFSYVAWQVSSLFCFIFYFSFCSHNFCFITASIHYDTNRKQIWSNTAPRISVCCLKIVLYKSYNRRRGLTWSLIQGAAPYILIAISLWVFGASYKSTAKLIILFFALTLGACIPPIPYYPVTPTLFLISTRIYFYICLSWFLFERAHERSFK